jgi:hypothetical protein
MWRLDVSHSEEDLALHGIGPATAPRAWAPDPAELGRPRRGRAGSLPDSPSDYPGPGGDEAANFAPEDRARLTRIATPTVMITNAVAAHGNGLR